MPTMSINRTATAIALFVYARPTHTKETIDALVSCDAIEDFPLYIFSDGPKSDQDEPRVRQTRELITTFQWAVKPNVFASDSNQGLARSIIDGVG